jgi:hypothetical protein
VGVDKSRYMPQMFGADDLDTMQLLRCAFDPGGLCNPARCSRPRGCAVRYPACGGAAPPGRLRPGRAVLMSKRLAVPAAVPASGLGGPPGRSMGRPAAVIGGCGMAGDLQAAPSCGALPPALPPGRGRRRRGGRGDARYAASPASVTEASAVMRVADEQDLAVVRRGSGSRLDWGAPPPALRPGGGHAAAGPGGRARGRATWWRGSRPGSGCGGSARYWRAPGSSSPWTRPRRRQPGRPGPASTCHDRRDARHRRGGPAAPALRHAPRPGDRDHRGPRRRHRRTPREARWSRTWPAMTSASCSRAPTARSG